VRADVLVSSRRNTAQKLSQLRADEMTDLFLLVQRVQAMIERYFATDSSTVVVQDGAAAGRTVEVGEFDAGAHTPRVQHVHVHVIPRKTSDYADPDEFYNAVGRPLNVSMNCLQLQSNDKSVANATAKHLRSRPDMAAEATVYQRLMYDS
jgi:bis(5'-adenosyl)-triphosphatase